MTSSTGATFGKVKAELAEKVRKLLAQAEDPGATVEEAATFTAKAQQLMSKYAIDLAMVTDAERIDKVAERGWQIDGPYAAHKVSIVNAVSRANDCRAVYTNLDGGAKYVDVVGFPDDVDWVQTLSGSLALQMLSTMASARSQRPARVHGRTFAVGFAEGFVHEVSVRLQQARRHAMAAAAEDEERRRAAGAGVGGGTSVVAASPRRSVELVLVAKGARVDDEYRVRFPHARSVSRYTRLTSWSGWEPGRAAGRRANLARGAVGDRRRLPA
ncbi:MAG TPA: DUF2786 domain-containing protein [Acidimicrobiales bacterium]|nr:DUF2786 domain-containing protein [Acidimicrobiales bacterium]